MQDCERTLYKVGHFFHSGYEKVSIGYGLFAADEQNGFYWVWFVCRRRAKRFPLGMVCLPQICEMASIKYVSLLQICEMASMGDRLSGVAVREDSHGVWLVCHRRAREGPRRVVGLSQICEWGSKGSGWSVADMREGVKGSGWSVP